MLTLIVQGSARIAWNAAHDRGFAVVESVKYLERWDQTVLKARSTDYVAAIQWFHEYAGCTPYPAGCLLTYSID